MIVIITIIIIMIIRQIYFSYSKKDVHITILVFCVDKCTFSLYLALLAA